MRRWLILLPLLAPGLALAQQQWLPKPMAELQLLDKVTARTSTLQAALNRPAQFGTLSITVRACNARPADEVPDAAVWLEVADSRRPASDRTVFRGWMFANAPGLHMLEHPVYDVRVLECK